METLKLRPDPRLRTKYYVATLLVALLMLAMCVPMGMGIGSDAGGRSGALIGLWIALGANALWIIPTLLLVGPYYRSISYEFDDDEVIVRAGVITRSVKHVPYRTVTNIEIKRGPLDRLLGIGTLKVQTAGMSEQGGAEQSLAGLQDVDAVYEQVAAALRAFRGALPPTQAGEEGVRAAAPAASNGALFEAMLAELKAIRRALEKDD
ncbi:MAG: hypothetical protein Kow00124_28280 [Anaerolineae bacterium]